MDPKRELTSVDIAALAGELGPYEGAGVDKAYLYDDDLLRLKLRHYERGRIELVVDLGGTKHARIADPERIPPAPERPPNFAMMLRNRLAGASFAGADQFQFDRILRFRFDRDDDSTTIVAELFGDGNVAVLDGAGDVVDCLETVRLKSRTVAPGSQYEYPEARFDPLHVGVEEFVARFEQSDTDVVRTLATQLNFGGLWAEELCSRADVEKTVPIAEASAADYRAIHDVVGELATRLSAGDLDPRVYRDRDDGRPVDVTPVPLVEYSERDCEVFDSFTDALDAYFFEIEAESEGSAGAGDDRPDFEAELAKQRRIIEQQEGAIENFEEQAEREREKAETLYAHYDLVDEVLSTIQDARSDGIAWSRIESRLAEGAEQGIPAAEAVEDIDGSQGSVTLSVADYRVELDATAGVEQNADRLYQEAKRIEEKKAGAEAAIEDTRAELAAVEQRRDQWESGGDDSNDETEAQDEDSDVDWLVRSSIPVRQSDHWYERFRWFHTSDDFLVIGGRDADDNEAIVDKYLEPGDRFLHAQARGGPATVLKATGPSEPTDPDIGIPDRSLAEAARFAVSYSSVWKDGRFAGDAYAVDHDQVSKTPESGEYLEKGGFAIRGDRSYYRDVAVGVAVGITCEPETRVIGGPPDPVTDRAETAIVVEPGRYAQNDIAKRLYREFRDRFADETFVRKVASPDLIQEFLPPGGSRQAEGG